MQSFATGSISPSAFVPVVKAPPATVGTMRWPPVPPSASVIRLPQDQYLHLGAPTEWWWHTGTLMSGDRTFGFEINAASFVGKSPSFGFSQMMLADVENDTCYQNTIPYFPPHGFNGSTWAESDPTKDWYAQLGSSDDYLPAIQVLSPGGGYTSVPTVEITGGGGSGAEAKALMELDPVSQQTMVAAILLTQPGTGYTSSPTVTISGGGGSGATARALYSYVTMNAPQANPTQNMSVKAVIDDQATGTLVAFDLMLSQSGPPFIVWGTGEAKVNDSGPPLEMYNYYYSLTRMQASGTVTIGSGAPIPVTGVTWMDHEYGAFGKQTTTPMWILQDMQLTNGVCISNSTSIQSTDPKPAAGQPIPAHATIQGADGTTWFVPSVITPSDPWPDPNTGPYFLEMTVEIPSFGAQFVVRSLMKAQLFPLPKSPVYEGVASVSGTFDGQQGLTGTAWNEQALG
jgi:predicted secreted hydrolase